MRSATTSIHNVIGLELQDARTLTASPVISLKNLTFTLIPERPMQLVKDNALFLSLLDIYGGRVLRLRQTVALSTDFNYFPLSDFL